MGRAQRNPSCVVAHCIGFAALYPSYKASGNSFRHSGMVRQHQTRNFEIRVRRFAPPRNDDVRHFPNHFGGRFSENAFGPSM